MLVYHDSKEKFVNDVFDGVIADKIKDELTKNHIGTSPAEYNAWNNSLQYMSNVMNRTTLPGDCEISIEYQIPLTSKRVDFIVTGMDENGHDQVIIIELKQWDRCEKVDDIEHHTVRAFVGGNVRDLAHPSYQAYSYKIHIKNYSEVAARDDVHLVPIACLHNFKEDYRDVITDPIYKDWIERAPVFLQRDSQRLSDFLSKHIKQKSKNGDLLYKIDHGRIRPAKALQDCLASLLRGNKDFMLMDEQITIFDRCRKTYADTQKDEEKRVMIIKGGPGTGKSVLAINLLNEFLRPQPPLWAEPGHVAYVTKNSAPRKCYAKILAKNHLDNGIMMSDLFRSPSGLCEVKSNIYDCLLIDEAHRLVTKIFSDWHGKNQIMEIINAARLSIFFIDESQRISTKDIGTVDSIVDWAKKLGVKPEHIYVGDNLVLSAQFRCNGSDGYVNFLDNLLGIRETANTTLDLDDFEFKVYDDPSKLRDDLRLKNDKNKARMMAGYCYDWNVKNKRGDWDIMLPGGFKAKWNAPSRSETWAVDDTFEEVGCIHTAQGLEFDHIGVFIGKDLLYRDGKVVTDRNAVSKDDSSSGIRVCKDEILADKLIRNTYKVLLTRGQKSCYVYAEDEALRKYIKTIIGQSEE